MEHTRARDEARYDDRLSMAASVASAGHAAAGGHRTLAEKAFSSLHDLIVTGAFVPGQRLLIEELAERLDMSPMPIREALRRLDAVGLVEHVPHRGARVTELSVEDLREVYEARLALEPLAVRHAAERFSDDDGEGAAAALARHVDGYRRDDAPAAWAAHTEFHFALYRAAGSRWLLRLITPLWESSERYRLASLPKGRSLDERRREHERILEACVARDPEAAALELRNHLALTANLVARSMGSSELFAIRELSAA
jgi:DNA-binding GntR family transcriptional regulator